MFMIFYTFSYYYSLPSRLLMRLSTDEIIKIACMLNVQNSFEESGAKEYQPRRRHTHGQGQNFGREKRLLKLITIYQQVHF